MSSSLIVSGLSGDLVSYSPSGHDLVGNDEIRAVLVSRHDISPLSNGMKKTFRRPEIEYAAPRLISQEVLSDFRDTRQQNEIANAEASSNPNSAHHKSTLLTTTDCMADKVISGASQDQLENIYQV